jgi:hypothetical protein
METVMAGPAPAIHHEFPQEKLLMNARVKPARDRATLHSRSVPPI